MKCPSLKPPTLQESVTAAGTVTMSCPLKNTRSVGYTLPAPGGLVPTDPGQKGKVRQVTINTKGPGMWQRCPRLATKHRLSRTHLLPGPPAMAVWGSGDKQLVCSGEIGDRPRGAQLSDFLLRSNLTRRFSDLGTHGLTWSLR